MEKPQKVSRIRRVFRWIEGVEVVTSLGSFLTTHWVMGGTAVSIVFGGLATLFSGLLGATVPYLPFMGAIVGAGFLVFIPLAWVLTLTARRQLGSEMMVKDGVFAFVDAEAAQERSSPNRIVRSRHEANTLEDQVVQLEELQAKVDELEQANRILSAWKEDRSDWDDEMERYGNLKGEHAGCANRVATLQARLDELSDVVPHLYEDQREVVDAGFGYDEVFNDEGVRSIWIATLVGGRLSEIADGPLGEKLDALIVAKPDSAFLKHVFTARGDETRLGYAQDKIREVARKAHASRATVAFHEFPVMQCMIVFRHDKQDWARWEEILPGRQPGEWPTTMVYEADHGELFQRLVKAYLKQQQGGDVYQGDPTP